MNRSLVPLSALVLILAVAPGGVAAGTGTGTVPRTVDVLPTLRGGSGVVSGINERGLLVGSSSAGDGTFHAVTWRDGRIRRLPGLAPGMSSQADGVDDRDRVVGMALDASGRAHAVRWRRGRIRDLGLTTTYGGRAAAASTAGIVGTGFAFDRFSGRRAFLRAPGGEPGLLDLPPGASADAISNGGTVVGTHSWRDVGDPRFDEHQAYALVDGRRIDLGTLGGPGSVATDVNVHDQVVGTTGTSDDALVSFVWSDGSMHRLPDDGLVSPSAAAISDGGSVVGTDGTTSRALWWPTTTSPPVVLVQPRRAVGTTALDLDESGAVVGFASRFRGERFVLLPVVWR